MSHVHRKRKEVIGASPLELITRKSAGTGSVGMYLFNITAEKIEERHVVSVNELKHSAQISDGFHWLNVSGIHDAGLLKEISDLFDVSDNIMSDVADPSLRPQVEDFDNGFYVSLKMLKLDEKSRICRVENVSLIVLDRLVISFTEHADDLFNPVRERIRKHNKSKIRTSGADFLGFALLDVIIDNYIYILDIFGESVDALEEKITLEADKKTLLNINRLKRELNHLRREIKPAKEMIFNLRKLDTDFISGENDTYFKELQDNISQVTEMLDYFREVLYDALDVYHSSMSTRLNDIMAVLTVFSVIFIPLSFIASLYGMNFVNMPELHSKYGYYVVLGVMCIIVIIMLFYFKRKKWF